MNKSVVPPPEGLITAYALIRVEKVGMRGATLSVTTHTGERIEETVRQGSALEFKLNLPVHP